MYEGDSRTQSFGVSSGVTAADPPPANTVFHLRPAYRRADELATNAAELRRFVDELEDPARRRLLAWCELAEQVTGQLRREALAALDALHEELGTPLAPSRRRASGVEL